MTDDALLGNIVGAGITLMVADRVLNPRRRTRVVYRNRRKTVKRRKRK